MGLGVGTGGSVERFPCRARGAGSAPVYHPPPVSKRPKAPAPPAILFTGFEPSGDDHASAVIAVLRERHPDLKMYAWGGPKMAAAGAEVVEQTGADAVMGVPGLAKIREHRHINERIAAWLRDHPITLHVPVDSPAANFPICKITRARGARVMHLVAPQVWAWASWRVRKLRRLTDHVCCLLPFEEKWFRDRGIRATFVGHPLFDRELDLEAIDREIAGWPSGRPRLALMPGSRPAEMEKNFPILLEAFRRLAREHADMIGIVAATTRPVEARLREIAAASGGWPDKLEMVHGQTDAVVRWCDLALVVSGTVTLQVAKQAKPMVIVYKSSKLMYSLVGRWIVSTPFFSLPNLIAGERIVPELIPHFAGADALVDEALGLLERPERAEQQRRALRRISEAFRGHHAASAAAAEIERLAGLPTTPAPAGA